MSDRESIVNKTTISARTNRTIGGAAPSFYLDVIESEGTDHRCPTGRPALDSPRARSTTAG